MPDPENIEGEGMRRAISEDLPHDLMKNFHLYEQVRLDKIYDQHISYTRSASRGLSEGKSLEYVVSTVAKEVPAIGMDMLLTVQLVNYFLEKDGHDVRFDAALNAVLGENIVMASGATLEDIRRYTEALAEDRRRETEALMQAYAIRIHNGHPLHIIVPFLKADVIWENYDAEVCSTQLNAHLEVLGTTARFDKYFELINDVMESADTIDI